MIYNILKWLSYLYIFIKFIRDEFDYLLNKYYFSYFYYLVKRKLLTNIFLK